MNLVQQIKAHAALNYNEGGWDVLVECYTDAEIATLIEGASTFEEAVAACEDVVDIYADREADAENSAF